MVALYQYHSKEKWIPRFRTEWMGLYGWGKNVKLNKDHFVHDLSNWVWCENSRMKSKEQNCFVQFLLSKNWKMYFWEIYYGLFNLLACWIVLFANYCFCFFSWLLDMKVCIEKGKLIIVEDCLIANAVVISMDINIWVKTYWSNQKCFIFTTRPQLNLFLHVNGQIK